MIILAAIRKFLRLDNEIISLDIELINSTGLMMEDGKYYMKFPYLGCFGFTKPPMNFDSPIHLPDLHIGDMGNC